MCDTVIVGGHDVNTCGELLERMGGLIGRTLQQSDLVQHGSPLDLTPLHCLCNVDIPATATALGLQAREIEDWQEFADYEVTMP